MKKMLLPLLLTALAACSPPQLSEPQPQAAGVASMPSGKEPVSAMTQQQLYQHIQQMVGKAAADEVSQCRIAPLGHKPCGGPASYLVYSVRDLDEATLLAAIAQYTALDQTQHQAAGLVSDCSIVPEPVATLQHGVCVAMPAHLASNLE